MRSVQRTAVGMGGVAATLLLHGLLFAVAVWDGGFDRTTRLPDAMGAGANAGQPDGASGERRMFVMLTPEFSTRPPPMQDTPQLPEPELEQAIVEITGPDALPLPPLEFERPDKSGEEADAELVARARLAGLYESQIRARIERAWMLPEPSGPDPGFSCRVHIHQQPDGRIDEVALDLEACGETPAWQSSLVRAVFTASPLPAPPHPGVFVERFSLVLRSSAVHRPELLTQR